MSDHKHLDWFTNNGQTTPDGQRAAGAWEAHNHSQPATRAPHESADAYWQRFNSYNDTKNSGS